MSCGCRTSVKLVVAGHIKVLFSFSFSQNRKVPIMHYHHERVIYTMRPARAYGFWKFVGDILMTCLTGGLWLIWIFVREMRRR